MTQKLNRTYTIKEIELPGKCDLCNRWFKGKALGSENPPYILTPEFAIIRDESKIILCKSCYEKKHLGGFKNESNDK